MSSSSRQPNFALLLGLAWVLIVGQLLYQHWGHTAQTLNDTDDAMRLVQMRAFLSGQGWFDLHQTRVQPGLGLDSHWSRLIDAGLAGIFLLFNLVFEASLAERLMRAIWPMLWLLPTMAGAAALAWRLAGREGALVAVLFAVIGMPAFSQFIPGRIDHHNVQIALALTTVAATAWSDRVAWGGWAAGALSGLALAIGFECLPYVALCGVVFAVRFAIDRAGTAPLVRYGTAVAASTFAAFIVSIGPGAWTQPACDMIAFNNALPVVISGALLAFAAQNLASAPVRSSWQVRSAVVGAVSVVSGLVFVVSEPRCMDGPFAMVDPEIWPIWLAHVNEMQPLLRFVANDPRTGLWFVTFPAVALIAAMVLARNPGTRRDFGFLTTTAVFLLAVATSFATIKGAPYAIWFGMPLVAALAVELWRVLKVESLIPRFVLVMLLAPAVITGGAVSIAAAATHENATGLNDPKEQACFATQSYAPLAQLPPGLIASNLDFGPFLLALTSHSALAAPYHRLSVGIVAAHHALADPPDAAREILARFHATYVVTCGPQGPAGLNDAQRSASLWGRLQAGDIPPWLEPIPHAADQAFVAYRIRPSANDPHLPALSGPSRVNARLAGAAGSARTSP